MRSWDNHGGESAWSEPAHWDVGVFDSSEWKAHWIEPDDEAFVRSRVAPIFRTEFRLDKPVQRATAFVTAHGVYVAEINGRRVGDVQLAPGWTSYHKRLEYQQYDVTELLRQGANAIGATVGQGWWRGASSLCGQAEFCPDCQRAGLSGLLRRRAGALPATRY